MATDLAEILTDLTAHAMTASRSDTDVAMDARIALSRLRPALDRLHDDGLDTGGSTVVDPDGFTRQAERVHWVRLLSNTCARLGHATPTPETPGPMTRLADAAAVAAVLHAEVLTSGQRWAIVASLARTANHLVTAAGGGDLQVGEITLDTATHIVRRRERELSLTRKEFGVLRYLMARPDHLISVEELLTHVWDENADPFSQTVRVTVGTLRRKLTVGDESPLLQTVVGRGYRLRDAADAPRPA